jgi:hypothetical protein
VPSVSPAGTVLAALRFAPGAAGPALGMPMSALLNQRVAAGDLGTAQARALARALPGSLAPAEALRVRPGRRGDVRRWPADPLAARATRRCGARAPGPRTSRPDGSASASRLRRRPPSATPGDACWCCGSALRVPADAGAPGPIWPGRSPARIRRPGTPHRRRAAGYRPRPRCSTPDAPA